MSFGSHHILAKGRFFSLPSSWKNLGPLLSPIEGSPQHGGLETKSIGNLRGKELIEILQTRSCLYPWQFLCNTQRVILLDKKLATSKKTWLRKTNNDGELNAGLVHMKDNQPDAKLAESKIFSESHCFLLVNNYQVIRVIFTRDDQDQSNKTYSNSLSDKIYSLSSFPNLIFVLAMYLGISFIVFSITYLLNIWSE